MISVDKAVIARLKKDEKIFEVLVDCEKAMALKEGKSVSIDDILAIDRIYKDSKKGFEASEADLKNVFKITDVREIAKRIIKEGEVQLTKEYRDNLREEKRKQIINIIHRNAIDSKTNLPHPPKRIENAMIETKVNIDDHKSAEEQVEAVVKKLREVIPIKFETREILVKIPAKYTGKAYIVVKKFGEILKEEWQKDGSLVFLTKLPAGLQDEYFAELNNLTHGDIETKIVKSD